MPRALNPAQPQLSLPAPHLHGLEDGDDASGPEAADGGQHSDGHVVVRRAPGLQQSQSWTLRRRGQRGRHSGTPGGPACVGLWEGQGGKGRYAYTPGACQRLASWQRGFENMSPRFTGRKVNALSFPDSEIGPAPLIVSLTHIPVNAHTVLQGMAYGSALPFCSCFHPPWHPPAQASALL